MKDIPARHTPSFAQIREGNLYYADKTGFLEDFFLGSRADVNILLVQGALERRCFCP